MQRDRKNLFTFLLDDLQAHPRLLLSVAPQTELMVQTRCQKELPLETGLNSCDLCIVKRVYQIGKFANIMSFLSYMSHLQELLALCCVHDMLTSDSCTCQGNVLLALQTSQVREPRLLNICSRRQIFVNLVRLFDFTGDLVNLKLSTVINHNETVLGSGHDHQDVEGGTRRRWQKQFEVAGRLCYQNVTCRCANEEFPIDPTVTGVICRNEVSVLFYEAVMHECQLHATVELHVAVNILSSDEQKSGIFWVE